MHLYLADFRDSHFSLGSSGPRWQCRCAVRERASMRVGRGRLDRVGETRRGAALLGKMVASAAITRLVLVPPGGWGRVVNRCVVNFQIL